MGGGVSDDQFPTFGAESNFSRFPTTDAESKSESKV